MYSEKQIIEIVFGLVEEPAHELMADDDTPEEEILINVTQEDILQCNTAWDNA